MTLILLLTCLVLAFLLYVVSVGGEEKRADLLVDIYRLEDENAELTWANSDLVAENRRLQIRAANHPSTRGGAS